MQAGAISEYQSIGRRIDVAFHQRVRKRLGNTFLLILAATLMSSVSAPGSKAAVRQFFKPTIFGDTLAGCPSSRCSKLIADGYCRRKNYGRAITFQLNRMADTGSRARTIDNRLVVISAATPSFVFIKCHTSRTADRR